jgi:hypothetical protein
VLAVVVLAVSLLPTVLGSAQEAPGKPAGSLKLVGHEPLMNRGMNAALAVHGDYAYVGSRTDGKAGNLNGAGVLVVDISKPSAPKVVHQIGPSQEGNSGETSRELRVWPQQDLLIVMNLGSNCSFLIHACSPLTVDDNFRFYDISGKRAAKPKLVAEYKPSVNPHEFFFWSDPTDAKRALLFMSTPGGNSKLLVTDISKARNKKFKELLKTSIPGAEDNLHSLSVSNDGSVAQLAHLTAGFYVIDTSELARGVKKPNIKILTSPQNAPKWEGPGAHSAVKLFGKDWVLVTDEVYGEALRALGGHGCPWGWVRMIDISNPGKPKVKAQYRLEQNHEEFCTTDIPRPSSSYSAHNPTLTEHLAFVTWHSGGLQAIDISNPAKPKQAAVFVPDPLLFVTQEDPALSAGQDKVVMWSYPVIKNGLIYVVDLRNGLYILKYKGPFDNEVSNTIFLEGNSNLGDAVRFEPVIGDALRISR